MSKNLIENQYIHSAEMDDIITDIPSWIVRWGFTLFLFILIVILALSAIIKYPESLNTFLVIQSTNAPKPVVSKISSKIVKLMVYNGQEVQKGQFVAYMESIAQPEDVLATLAKIKLIQMGLLQQNQSQNINLVIPTNLQMGELQEKYQSFYQEYLTYKSFLANGIISRKKSFLISDYYNINRHINQLKAQIKVQMRDLALADSEYQMHKILTNEKVETKSELNQEESKFLSKKIPLINTQTQLSDLTSNFSDKEMQVSELNDQISEGRYIFLQGINSMISQIQDWISKFILVAPGNGKLSFVGNIQENQIVNTNQIAFYVSSGKEAFYGEAKLPQYDMGKIEVGQNVLIKFQSYPFEEYGIGSGTIYNISDFPDKDSSYTALIHLQSNNTGTNYKKIHYKQGLVANAEIILRQETVLGRLTKNMFKLLNDQ